MSLNFQGSSFKKQGVLKEKINENAHPISKLSIHDRKTIEFNVKNQSTIESIKCSLFDKNSYPSMKSSKIAQQKSEQSRVIAFTHPQQPPINYDKYVEKIKVKVNLIQTEGDKIIKNKQEENRMLKEQIKTLQNKIGDLESKLLFKEKEVNLLRRQNLENKNLREGRSVHHIDQNQIKFLVGEIDHLNSQIHQTIQQNEKLRNLLNQEILNNYKNHEIIASKNEQISKVNSYKTAQKAEPSSNTLRKDNYLLKRQIQELQKLFTQMKQSLKNCPSCQLLTTENSKLTYSCEFLEKELAALKRQISQKQSSLLNEIKQRACQNQYIKRQNRDIKLDQAIRESYYHLSCQKRSRCSSKARDDVAKRCRTLTDIEY